MMDRTFFETAIREFAQAEVGSAATPIHAAEMGDEQRAHDELIRAYKRLAAQPSLFSGDEGSVFTYEDPILASAVLWGRLGCELEEQIGAAVSPGYELRNANVFGWALTGVQAWLSRGDRAFATLGGRTPTDPITLDEPSLRIAVIGDAGYRGGPQTKVIQLMLKLHRQCPFHLVIHLGDVYFAGGDAAMLEHFLAPFGPLRTEGARVLTLCGNHDLYYGAEGYSHALDALGQPGRYFLIETPHWRIACLDTALGAERILRNDGKLDDGQLNWLKRTLDATDKRPLLLMSHHFIVSGWDAPAESLDDQLRDLIGNRVFAWYWGHEHRSATYDRSDHGFYGACVGNGAFLERWSQPQRVPKPTWYAENRCKCFRRKPDIFWPHGFLELQLDANRIVERFHLEGGKTHTRVLPGPGQTRADTHGRQSIRAAISASG